MAKSFTVHVEDAAVRAALARLQEKTNDLSPAMREIARMLRNTAEDSFQNKASPNGDPWEKYSDATEAIKKRQDKWPARLLEDSGGLAASIGSQSDRLRAILLAGKEYAAIHQFGGVTSAGSWIPGKTIPARPFMPVSASGELFSSTRESILDIIERHLGGG